jgi:LysM repeat protein
VDQARRDELRRWAAPVAFLVGLTIAVVLIHNGLSSGDGGSTPAVTSVPAATTTFARTRPSATTSTATQTSSSAAEYYVVQSGDTFGTIASRYGTSVTQIEALNPGVSSNALTVGQKIRVK